MCINCPIKNVCECVTVLQLQALALIAYRLYGFSTHTCIQYMHPVQMCCVQS